MSAPARKLTKHEATLLGAVYTAKYEKKKGISKQPQNLEKAIAAQAELERQHLARLHEPARTTRQGTLSAPPPVAPSAPPGRVHIAVPAVTPAQIQANLAWLTNPIAGGGAVASPKDLLATTPGNVPLTRQDVNKLSGNGWLNDEVINAAVDLFRHKGGNPGVVYLETNFFEKLENPRQGPDKVDRYTTCARAVVLKEGVKFVVCPINKYGNHWVVLLIDLMNRNLQYFDSLGGPAGTTMDLAKTWLKVEYQNKLGFDAQWASAIDQWPAVTWGENRIPCQHNDVDCGVFAIMYMYYITRDAVIDNHCFAQANIPAFRELIKRWLREWALN